MFTDTLTPIPIPWDNWKYGYAFNPSTTNTVIIDSIMYFLTLNYLVKLNLSTIYPYYYQNQNVFQHFEQAEIMPILNETELGFGAGFGCLSTDENREYLIISGLDQSGLSYATFVYRIKDGFNWRINWGSVYHYISASCTVINNWYYQIGGDKGTYLQRVRVSYLLNYESRDTVSEFTEYSYFGNKSMGLYR